MAAFVQHMGVKHRRADVLVTEQFLDCSDVITHFKKMCGNLRASQPPPGGPPP
jgi:hypothetical protein